MTTPGVFTPYSTLQPFFPGTMPTWIPDVLDQQRIMSYQIYEQIYWDVPETFKLVARGTEDKPIYIPSAKTIVETIHRFTAASPKLNLKKSYVNPATDQQVMDYQQVWDNLFKRENFWSKLNANKRYGLIRGDWLWYIIGDETKPEGSRLSIRMLDPASYFPIWDEDDIDRIIGCHIVDHITNAEGEQEIRRTTYLKPGTSRNPGQFVTREQAVFAVDNWGGPEASPLRTIVPVTQMQGITSLPVYHIRNFDEPQNPFGSSEIRGIERLIAAVNQGISDQELALALDGLGVYETDAPPPTDDDGNTVDWVLGPGRVVEHPPATNFRRVQGVGNVSPSLDHLNWLIQRMREGSGVPDVAIGSVDVSVAESGIALSLKFAPILAKTDEKDTFIQEVLAQMFYDLQTQWFPQYEGITMTGVMPEVAFGDKLPLDRTARVNELNEMLDRRVISAQFYRDEMKKFGYVFPTDIEAQVNNDLAREATASDPYGDRINSELGGDNAEGEALEGDAGGQEAEA